MKLRKICKKHKISLTKKKINLVNYDWYFFYDFMELITIFN